MINLLPPAELQDITYARHNTRLRSWAVVGLLSILGIAGIVGAGRLIIDNSASRVSGQVSAATEQLKIQKVDEVEKRVEDISGSLKLASEVLSRQVVLSGLIQRIGSVLPSGTVLSGLQLTKIEGGIDLSIIARDYQAATQVQINLQDPDNKLFKQADIVNINCSSEATAYPCQTIIRALFADENPYTFLGEGEKK